MIHCIGNSHLNSLSFSGYTNFHYSENSLFKFFWLGPVIAYNFYEHHFEKVKKEYLQKTSINKQDDFLIFVVGEVDCRLHIPKQADAQNITDQESVSTCVTRFFRIYEELPEYKIIVLGTHPTTIEGHNMDNLDRPIYGDWIRRNNICVMWNDRLKEEAVRRGYPFVSIYHHLVDSNNKTKMEYFRDYCHLDSIKVKPFFVEEFSKIGVKL